MLSAALSSASSLDAAEPRTVAVVLSALNDSARGLERDTAERLRASREQALARRKAARTASQTSDTPVLAPRPLGWASGAAPGTDRRLSEGLNPFTGVASLLPLVLLVVGLAVLSQATAQWRASELAELDAQLLTAELPPAAYADSGFVEFLRASHADAAAAGGTASSTDDEPTTAEAAPADARPGATSPQAPGS